MSKVETSLDTVLSELGDFGKYQILVLCLISLGIIVNSGINVAYVFTAMNIEHRCEIPDCDIHPAIFNPEWLPNAVPYKDDKPAKCEKYTDLTNCSKTEASSTANCDNFVYKTQENSILHEFDLQCEDKLWMLTLVGTINSAGQFFGLLLAGLFSDKFGRKLAFVIGMSLSGFLGVVRVFSPSYVWFLVFEFLEAAIGGPIYGCGFVIAVELVGPTKRVHAANIINLCYPIGEILIAGLAWIVQDWKVLSYVFYGASTAFCVYYFIIPESLRWSLSKGRADEAKTTLRQLAKVNKKILPEATLEDLVKVKETENKFPFTQVFTSRSLVVRLVICSCCWMTCTFLFYGLTLNSVTLAGNSYLDFIFTALVEIPAIFSCTYLSNKFGRTFTISGTLFLTSLCCLTFMLLPDDNYPGTLTVYLIGKFGASCAFSTVYVITSELFPTCLRQSTMNFCSMIGRIGTIVAPQIPLLAEAWKHLPMTLFIIIAALVGGLTLFLPETVGTILPETIEDSVNIGRRRNNIQ